MSQDQLKSRLVVYVDVDDTLIHSVGTKQIPMTETIAHVQQLHAHGAELYCWSSGGAAYARDVADRFGIADLFTAFLPKPHVLVDDQAVSEWRRLRHVHPMQCENESVETYRLSIDPRVSE